MFGRRKKTYRAAPLVQDRRYDRGESPKPFAYGNVLTYLYLNASPEGLRPKVQFKKQNDDGSLSNSFCLDDLDDIMRGATRAVAELRNGIKVTTK